MNADKLKSLFNYDRDSGIFTRRTNNNGYKVGDVVGGLATAGYLTTVVKGKVYRLHRLAWLYEYGTNPNDEIDHINHIRNDNRINNLRSVTKQENMKNKSKHKNNTSGVTGVSWSSSNSKWLALIYVDKKRIPLGYFVQFHEAVNARKNAEVLYGFHENHGKDL